MKLRGLFVSVFAMAICAANAQVLTNVYGSGSYGATVSSDLWYSHQVWVSGSGRDGGGGHWETVWSPKSLQDLVASYTLGLNSSFPQKVLTGTAFSGTYGTTIGAYCNYEDTGTAATFNLASKSLSKFGPILGAYNNAEIATSFKYVFQFTSLNPFTINLTASGPVGVSIVGGTGDGPVNPVNGVLNAGFDPGYYTMTVETSNSIFRDAYKNTSWFYGQLNEGFVLKMVITPGGGD